MSVFSTGLVSPLPFFPALTTNALANLRVFDSGWPGGVGSIVKPIETGLPSSSMRRLPFSSLGGLFGSGSAMEQIFVWRPPFTIRDSWKSL